MATDTPDLTAVVLAAGQGTRMRSSLPKPLHELCGRPMLLHVLDALTEVAPTRVIVVVGRGADRVVAAVEGAPLPFPVLFAEQVDQLGTGDAVRVALDAYPDAGPGSEVVVLPGDAPLLRPATLTGLVRVHRAATVAGTLLTARMGDPTGYGRVIRGEQGRVEAVVEQADATPDQAVVDEVNTSVYCFDRGPLEAALGMIGPDNAQGEWYLTDVVGLLARGAGVGAWTVDDPVEAYGVNDRAQLAAAGAVLGGRIADAWMHAGVTILSPATTRIDVGVVLGADVTLHPGVTLGGDTVVGEGAVIGPNASVVDATIGAGARVGASAVIDAGVVVARGEVVPPLSHLVGGAPLDAD